MPEEYDIHAITRGESPFQTCRIVLEQASHPDPTYACNSALDSVRDAFVSQFGVPAKYALAYATERP